MLDTTEKGGVRNSIRNCLTVFQYDPLLAGALAYNLLTDRTDLVKPIGYQRPPGASMTDTDVKDLLASREIENILDNTDFMVLLSQAQSDRAILAKQLGISEHQLSYITRSNSGEGLLFYGNVTIPFLDRFPRGEIYDLLTTRPEDLAHEQTDE